MVSGSAPCRASGRNIGAQVIGGASMFAVDLAGAIPTPPAALVAKRSLSRDEWRAVLPNQPYRRVGP